MAKAETSPGTTSPTRSGLRLRIGVACIAIWWLPVWLLAPAIAALLGKASDASAEHRILITLIIVQTIFGAIGVIIASRQVVTLLKKVPRKKVPGELWHILRTGKSDNLG